MLSFRINKSSRNDLEIYEDFFCRIYKKYWRKNQPEKWSVEPTSPPGAPPAPLAAPGRLVGPTELHRLQFQLYLVPSVRKKSRRRVHRVLRYGGAATSCSSSGGQIWSPFWAPERGNRRHRHHQPSSLSNSMKLFVVRE